MQSLFLFYSEAISCMIIRCTEISLHLHLHHITSELEWNNKDRGSWREGYWLTRRLTSGIKVLNLSLGKECRRSPSRPVDRGLNTFSNPVSRHQISKSWLVYTKFLMVKVRWSDEVSGTNSYTTGPECSGYMVKGVSGPFLENFSR